MSAIRGKSSLEFRDCALRMVAKHCGDYHDISRPSASPDQSDGVVLDLLPFESAFIS